MRKILLLAGLLAGSLFTGCATTPGGDEPNAFVTTAAGSDAGASVMVGVRMDTVGFFPVIFKGRPEPGSIQVQAEAPPKKGLLDRVLSSPGALAGWTGRQVGNWWEWSSEHPGQSTASALVALLGAGEMMGSDLSFSGVADLITGNGDSGSGSPKSDANLLKAQALEAESNKDTNQINGDGNVFTDLSQRRNLIVNGSGNTFDFQQDTDL